jgi:hypothetical protein
MARSRSRFKIERSTVYCDETTKSPSVVTIEIKPGLLNTVVLLILKRERERTI